MTTETTQADGKLVRRTGGWLCFSTDGRLWSRWYLVAAERMTLMRHGVELGSREGVDPYPVGG